MACAAAACPLAEGREKTATEKSRSTAGKGGSMRISTRYWGLGVVATAAATAVVLFAALPSSASGSAQHVRWDIITLTGVPAGSLNPGGHASATAANGGGTITLTGSGTFVAPAAGGP